MLYFLSGLGSIRYTHVMHSYQFIGAQLTTVIAPGVCEALETGIFPHTMLGPIMTKTKHDMINKFLKMKPPTLLGSEIEDVFEFITDGHKRLFE